MLAGGRRRCAPEIGLRSPTFADASSRSCLDTTCVTRHKTPLLIRYNQNALTELDAEISLRPISRSELPFDLRDELLCDPSPAVSRSDCKACHAPAPSVPAADDRADDLSVLDRQQEKIPVPFKTAAYAGCNVSNPRTCRCLPERQNRRDVGCSAGSNRYSHGQKGSSKFEMDARVVSRVTQAASSYRLLDA